MPGRAAEERYGGGLTMLEYQVKIDDEFMDIPDKHISFLKNGEFTIVGPGEGGRGVMPLYLS